jgi:hypothetical protein
MTTGEKMFDFNQLRDLDTAVCSHRAALRRKREQLAKRPIGRNYVARERQLDAMLAEEERMTQLVLDIRAAIRPHIDEISAQLSA